MEWIYLILGLGVMLFGADMIVKGCTSLARRIGFSEFIIAFVIVGIGTSLPELMVSFLSGPRNMDELVISNAIGSNIINILGILGLGALIYPILTSEKKHTADFVFLGTASIIITVMIFMGPVGKLDAGILLGLMVLYLFCGWRIEKNQNPERKYKDTSKSVGKITLLILVGTAAIFAGSDVFMNCLDTIIKNYHVNQTIAGIFIVAPGTSFPELLVTIIASVKRRPQVMIGNIVGSNFVNIVLIISAGALVSDLGVSRHIKIFDIWVMLLASGLLCFNLLYQKKISRPMGAVYLLLLAIYLCSAIMIK